MQGNSKPVKRAEETPYVEPVGEKLAAWVCARNHDVDVICGYLNKFRESDEQLLTAAPPPSENSPHDVVPQRAMVRMKSNVVISGPQLEAASPPQRVRRVSKNAVRPRPRPRPRVICAKTGVCANGRNRTNANVSPSAFDRRNFSPPRSRSGEALHQRKMFRRVSSGFRGNVPRQVSPQVPRQVSPQEEEGRQLVRKKREEERKEMIEMIREQRAKLLQERKAGDKKKARDVMAVEIILPANVRYVCGAAK